MITIHIYQVFTVHFRWSVASHMYFVAELSLLVQRVCSHVAWFSLQLLGRLHSPVDQHSSSDDVLDERFSVFPQQGGWAEAPVVGRWLGRKSFPPSHTFSHLMCCEALEKVSKLFLILKHSGQTKETF